MCRAVTVTCLGCLLLSIWPVPSSSEIQLKITTLIYLVKENEEFKLECQVSDEDGQALNPDDMKWQRENKKGDTIDIKGADGYGTIKTTKDESGSVKSVLTVQRPPTDLGKVFYYHCSYGDKSENIPLSLLKEKAIPKVTPIGKANITAEFQKTVYLACQVSYDNTNGDVDKIKLTVGWRKNGMELMTVEKTYNNRNVSFLFHYNVTVKASIQGGTYSCWSELSRKGQTFSRSANVELRIPPALNGPYEKEVKVTAGDDAELVCDIIGYPLEYRWQFEDGDVIGNNISRFTADGNKLNIDDTDYKDRQAYLCIGVSPGNATDKRQKIILRVKDRLAALWPFIGILIEAVILAMIIIGCERWRSKRNSENDAGNPNTEKPPASEAPSTTIA